VLEDLTAEEPEVHCFHRSAPIGLLEGVGFTDRARVRRRIIHHFTGLPGPETALECVVIAPDLSPALRSRRQFPDAVGRLLLGAYLGGQSGSPGYWRRLLGRDFSCRLAVETDETRWAILDLSPQWGGRCAAVTG
jgi:hypothetical protein